MTNQSSRHIPAFWIWLLTVILLTLVRYNIADVPGETLSIHNAIADSILDGNKWGQLALVKILDVPLLPTIALVITKAIAAIFRLDAAALLVAVSQSVAAVAIAALVKPRRAVYAVIAVAAVAAIPFFRNFILVSDPNWIAAIPLAFIVLALDKWNDSPSLLRLTVIASLCALLVFCGPILAVSACAFLIVFAFSASGKFPVGGQAILWLPYCYALILWLPWYSPLHDNFITQIIHDLGEHQAGPFAVPFAPQALTALAVSLFILMIRTASNMVARCLLPVLVLLPLAAAACSAANISPTAEGALLFIIAAATVVIAIDAVITTRKTPQIAAAAAMVVMLVLGCRYDDVKLQVRPIPEIILKEKAPVIPSLDDFKHDDAPTAEDLAETADREWPNGRIVIAGDKLPVLYPDKDQKRFVPKVVFSSGDFISQNSEEQLLLLVPPNDGRFYDQNSPLSDIHDNGAPYLFLVKRFPNDWQLWRGIR